MKIDLVIFDMDGILFDTESVFFKCWMEELIRRGKVPNKNLFFSGMGGRHINQAQIYKEHYGNDIDVDDLYCCARARARKIINEGIKIKPGVTELISFLDEKKIKKAVASSNAYHIILNNFELSGINLNNFDFVISGEQVEITKPNPEIFLKCCEKLNVNKENTIILEDSINGINAAYSANIKCFMVPDLIEPNDDLKNKAYKILNNIADVIAYID